MRQWLAILDFLGKAVFLFGLLMLFPISVSLLTHDGQATIFFFSALSTITIGLTLWLIGRSFRGNNVTKRHSFLLIIIIWTMLPIFAAAPILSIVPSLSIAEAYFEATSGLTATGATVLSGLDNMPPSLNFWRAQLIWLGGMGLIVLAVAILPFLGIGGRQLFKSEMPGPMKEEKLTPQLAETAKGLWKIYATLTIVCILSYKVAGMELLDAFVHGFTTLGLGGFSSHDASYQYFDSPLIEAIAIFFMLLAGMNFATHFAALYRKTPKAYLRDIEWRYFIGTLAVIITIITIYLWKTEVYPDLATSFRYAIFNSVSVVTTTGYSNADFGSWPIFAPLLILFFANFTACGGSTGGGIKMMRFLIVLGQSNTEKLRLLHPNIFHSAKVGNSYFPSEVVVSVIYFILAYVCTIILLMLALTATGLDFLTAFSASIASISNTGPGLGSVGPASNYSHLTDLQTWLCSLGMLLGRLELLAFFVVTSINFWRD